jgi:hypothetical protein
MKPKQAFKIVNEYFQEGIKELNWDANMFDRGLSREPRNKRASEKRKKAHEAINTLYQLVNEKEKIS